MSKVTILLGEKMIEVEAAQGALLGDVIASAEMPVEQPCAGRGTCGRCKMLVEKGAGSPDEIEREYLTDSELSLGTRLACRAKVISDTQVVLSPIEVYTNKVFRSGSRHKRDHRVPLGLAIDLGSTTVAAYLTLLDTGEVVSGGAALNQQRVYGADVISRLSAALNSSAHQERLQRLSLSSIYQAIDALKLSKSLQRRIERVSIVGNVAMHHLLLGLPVKSIAMMPFQPFEKALIKDASGLLGGMFKEDVEVILPPMIGGFVGSDALACLAYFGYDKVQNPVLTVDLGTNGEVLLTDGDRIVAASTAAGPAFEGVDISCGMRAVPGAIVDAVFANGRFEFKTIEDELPRGLTGSGLLKVVDELVRIGVIDPSGKFCAANCELPIDQIQGKKAVFLTEDHSVWLTQQDVRELQKAKGAIRAAVEILLKDLVVQPEDLDRIILTGSFGGQLDVSSVLGLGMLPKVSAERVENIANGAGFGAARFLLADGEELAQRLANRTKQIDLDYNAKFQELFIESLQFGV